MSKPMQPTSSLFDLRSRRFHLIMLIMAGFSCTTFMRMHLSITMTCMVNSTAVAIEEDSYYSNTSVAEVLLQDEFDSPPPLSIGDGKCVSQGDHHIVIDYGGTLDWSHNVQNLIFSGTFWGALFAVGPSMFIIQRFSPRLLLAAAVAVYILVTVITPPLAIYVGYKSVFLARVFMGLGEGFVLPSINAIIANWYPIMEKSTALALFTAGNQLAGAGGAPLAAILCASEFGWPSVFYAIAAIAILWSILWLTTSSNRPSECKWMSTREREYLKKHVFERSSGKTKSQSVPYLAIFTSIPFLAQLQCHFITNMTMTFTQIYMPSFLKDILLLGVVANGTFTAIPHFFNVSFKLFWSMTMDRMKAKKTLTPTQAVRLSQFIANFGCIGLIAIAFFVDCSNPKLALAFLCFMYGCMGAFTSGFYTSLLSLAPRYTGTMSTISQFSAMMGRLATPLIITLVKKSGTIGEWRILFLLTAASSIISGIIFVLFGSGEVQPWGREDEVAEPHELEKLTDETAKVRTESMCENP